MTTPNYRLHHTQNRSALSLIRVQNRPLAVISTAPGVVERKTKAPSQPPETAGCESADAVVRYRTAGPRSVCHRLRSRSPSGLRPRRARCVPESTRAAQEREIDLHAPLAGGLPEGLAATSRRGAGSMRARTHRAAHVGGTARLHD